VFFPAGRRCAWLLPVHRWSHLVLKSDLPLPRRSRKWFASATVPATPPQLRWESHRLERLPPLSSRCLKARVCLGHGVGSASYCALRTGNFVRSGVGAEQPVDVRSDNASRSTSRHRGFHRAAAGAGAGVAVCHSWAGDERRDLADGASAIRLVGGKATPMTASMSFIRRPSANPAPDQSAPSSRRLSG
jgi:hypothetical protein